MYKVYLLEYINILVYYHVIIYFIVHLAMLLSGVKLWMQKVLTQG